MAVIINTNVDSLKIQNILTDSTNKMAKSMQHMSTGLKINQASDDAAGTVISARMNVQLDGNKICQNNVQNANALLSTAEGNIDVVLDNMSRIRDLTLQAKNGTYSTEEVAAMQAEVDERIAEINRVSKSAKYSQLQLFGECEEKYKEAEWTVDGENEVDGEAVTKDTPGAKLTAKEGAQAVDKKEDNKLYVTVDGEKKGLAKDGAKFQVGTNATENDTIEADKELFGKITFSALTGIDGDFSLASADLTKLDAAIDTLTNRKSLIGSLENRLSSALDTLTTQNTNLSSAKSIITDADIASEASNYTQNQILQQVSTSLLVQANQAPAIALSLI